MTNPAESLVALLDLEQIEVDIFRGRSPQESLQRVFGGQVAGQALVAAGRTTEGDRPVHSLHAYFLRPAARGAHRVPGGTCAGRQVVHDPPGHRRAAGPHDLQSDRLLPQA